MYMGRTTYTRAEPTPNNSPSDTTVCAKENDDALAQIRPARANTAPVTIKVRGGAWDHSPGKAAPSSVCFRLKSNPDSTHRKEAAYGQIVGSLKKLDLIMIMPFLFSVETYKLPAWPSLFYFEWYHLLSNHTRTDSRHSHIMFMVTRMLCILCLLAGNAFATFTVIVTSYTTETVCPITDTVTVSGKTSTTTRYTTSTVIKSVTKTVSVTPPPTTVTENRSIDITRNITRTVSVTGPPIVITMTDTSTKIKTRTSNETKTGPPHLTTTTKHDVVTVTPSSSASARSSSEIKSSHPPTETATSSPESPGSHPPTKTAISSPEAPGSHPPTETATSLPESPGSHPPTETATSSPESPGSHPPTKTASSSPETPGSHSAVPSSTTESAKNASPASSSSKSGLISATDAPGDSTMPVSAGTASSWSWTLIAAFSFAFGLF
ncbi:hypothetical protein PWT90_08720 [Aphanocladium album]|nr:hypothetical protein PWT90_08720 [Aphanocladium album]